MASSLPPEQNQTTPRHEIHGSVHLPALEERIPPDHPVRILDEILSRVNWVEWEGSYHGKLGQPPIHPSVMCKVLLFALLRRIRSSRQQELETNDQLDELFEDGQRADQLPPELSEVVARQEQLSAALAQLRVMDQQRKQDGINTQKNPAQLPINDHDSRILPNNEGAMPPTIRRWR